MSKVDLRDITVLVVGLGESGLAMACWLSRCGAIVHVADTRDLHQTNPAQVEALYTKAPEATLHCGAFQPEVFAAAELVALSPGVDPLTIPQVPSRIVSEIDLFSWGLLDFSPKSKVIGITGSNGKTTVTALTAHLLNCAGIRSVACGNISPSALDALMHAIDHQELPEVWVLELSSFQLESTHEIQVDAATVLNISEDHLDRHEGSIKTYIQAKSRIFSRSSVMVLNRDDVHSMSMSSLGNPVLSFGFGHAACESDYGIEDNAIWLGNERLVSLDQLALKGSHNASNAAAALALCAAIGVGAERLLDALCDFSGLAHRIERVCTLNDIAYYDDSKGSNVGATLAAIQSVPGRCALILGGDSKGQDFRPLVSALSKHGRAIALIGCDAKKIETEIAGCDLPIKHCVDMDEAVFWLSEHAHSGDSVLLSPACASFDMYSGYEHRAAVFIEAVRALGGDVIQDDDAGQLKQSKQFVADSYQEAA